MRRKRFYTKEPGSPEPEEPDAVEALATLAQDVEVDPAKDRTLAVDHSLLANGTALVQEHSRFIWWLLWPLLIAFSLVIALVGAIHILLVFFFAKKPCSDERKTSWQETLYERRLLGPRWVSRVFGFIHPYLGQVREMVTTSGALDIIYAVPVIFKHPRTVGEWLTAFLLSQPDGQAVRNRLRLTYTYLLESLQQRWDDGQQSIRVLSLASGSAQAVIEAVQHFLVQHPEADIKVRLVDLSGTSLNRANFLAQNRGLGTYVETVQENLRTYLETEPRSRWDIVEMVGFLDYRRADSIHFLVSQVYKILRANGVFIAAQIAPSPWSFLVRWTINWPHLIRRSTEDYREILIRAWGEQGIEIVPEAHRIHTISVCQKGDK